jgi:hypothetical protein
MSWIMMKPPMKWMMHDVNGIYNSGNVKYASQIIRRRRNLP